MAKPRLSAQEIDVAISQLPGWKYLDGKFHREFVFADFSEAVGFMMRSALACEQLDHHPNWSNVYRTVDVTLWTHDADGVTELDVKLAARMNAVSNGKTSG